MAFYVVFGEKNGIFQKNAKILKKRVAFFKNGLILVALSSGIAQSVE